MLRRCPAMSQLPDDISYERWVEHVFNHPVLDPAWYFHLDSEHEEEWDSKADPARTLAHLTCLFRQPAFLIRRFSCAQIDQGLGYLVSPSCSSHMFSLLETSIPWEERRECIEAMHTLYSELMAPTYGDVLGHLENSTTPELPHNACYMWWDVIPLYGGMKHADRDQIKDAVLHVFSKTLKLTSEACLESVLHGLSHWRMYAPDLTEPIVRTFLKSRPAISAALRRYAKHAAMGLVQ